MSKNPVYTEVKKITPAAATKMLEGNVHNRDLRQSHVEFLAKEMREGRWMMNAETIKFTVDDKLIDGQHRLWAIVYSEKTIDVLVAYNVPEESFDTIDIGLKRTGGDTLKVDGEKNATLLASGAIALELLGRGGFDHATGQRVTNQRVREIVEENPDLRPSIEQVKQTKIHKILPSSLAVALTCLFNRKDPGLTVRFLESVSTGIGLVDTDPFYQLREQMLRNAQSRTKLQRQHVAALCIKSWNIARDGRSSRQLRWSRDEKFPIIK